jgi:hypothetical protein
MLNTNYLLVCINFILQLIGYNIDGNSLILEGATHPGPKF